MFEVIRTGSQWARLATASPPGLWALGALLALAVGCGAPATASTEPTNGSSQPARTPTAVGGHLQQTVRRNAHVVFDVLSSTGCSNRGPTVSLDLTGGVHVGTVDAALVASNNARCTHNAAAGATAVVSLVAEEDIVVQKQGSLPNGSTGNPIIEVALETATGHTDWIALGRCVQGFNGHVETDILVDTITEADFTPEEGTCEGQGGPTVRVNGVLAIGGVNALLRMRNAGGTHMTDEFPAVVRFELIPDGGQIVFSKSMRLHDGVTAVGDGVGGNPHLWGVLGEALSLADVTCNDGSYLGRCHDF